jgi:preprotein translocase subunit SecE
MAKNKNKKMARVKSGDSAAGSGGAAQNSADSADAGTSTAKKKRVSPFTFIEQVRSETSKVTWPTRSEWVVTTIMVFIMVVLASTFFFLIDIVIKQAIQFLLGLGG